MKIFLFGSTGMLGNYVYRVLKEEFEVITINRNQYDVESCDNETLENILKNMGIQPVEDIIINCIGLIPQRKPDLSRLIKVNTLFPMLLNDIANRLQLKFIHITTDCVFSGKVGYYHENSEHDSKEYYGITKSLGENLQNACILRTSIIGEESSNKFSLLEWVKQNRNGTIKGYTNFYWNGVTCLTLANIIKHMIDKNIYWKGVQHIYSPDVATKYELCQWINEIYDLNITVEEFELDSTKYMILSSLYQGYNYFHINPIKVQLKELFDFSV